MTNSFRFIHAADIHLDSPLLGLEEFEDAPVDQIREATRKAVVRLVDLCLDEKAAFLLIAGDVYDGDWKSMATGRFFAAQMGRLTSAGVPVFMIKGNHDAASQVSKEVRLPDVHTFDTKRPETVELLDFDVAIHGQSYATREVTDNIALKYPPAVPGKLNIGMLHTSASSGGNLHAPYAPCTVEQLVGKGYDYWALGHVHQREVLYTDPHIIFPGNIQGRHIREPAPEGKGVTLVEVQHGSIADVRHIALDTVRWSQIEVDATGLESAEEAIILINRQVLNAVRECPDCLLATRIIVSGECLASLQIQRDPASFDTSVRAYVQDQSDSIWIEEIQVRTTYPDLSTVAADQGALADLLEFVRNSADRLEEPQKRLSSLVSKLELSAPGLVSELDLQQPDLLASLLVEAETLILSLASEESV